MDVVTSSCLLSSPNPFVVIPVWPKAKTGTHRPVFVDPDCASRIRDDTRKVWCSVASMDPFGRTYWVYILASRKHGTLYVGVTSDLSGRVYEHRAGITPGFTSKYGVNRLVYFEMFGLIDEAIAREKRLKRWRRDWKTRLIEESNPEWRDLYEEIAWQMR